MLHLAVEAIEEIVATLTPHYGADCPAAVVARASWPDEVVLTGTLETIAGAVRDAGVERTAVIVVGRALAASGFRDSHLYSAARERPAVAVTVLVLGGTSEARDLAGALAAEGTHVISSLAGRVERPRLPAGEVRVGGFGGPDALAAWLSEHEHCRSHRRHASVRAAHLGVGRDGLLRSGVPLLRLERPGWTPHADDDWHWVDDTAEAAAAFPDSGGASS